VSLVQWLVLAVTCVVGVAGLLLAASGGENKYALGLMLFVGAVIYVFIQIKQHFDRIDRLHS
jgi:uncharacterized membrane protein YhhN